MRIASVHTTKHVQLEATRLSVRGRFSLGGRLLVLVALLAAGAKAAAQQGDWRLTPYRIQAILAVDGPGRSADGYAAALPAYLADRVEAAVGPVWELETSVAAGIVRHRVLNELEALADDPSAEFGFAADKLVLLAVRNGPDGCDLAAREYDRYLERWGPTIRRQARQQAALAEQLFDLLRQVVAPLAQFDVDPENDRAVTMSLRGAALPQKSHAAQGVEPGDVFVPMLRRTSRDGKLLERGIQALPWTYVEIVKVDEDGAIAGRIHSGTRLPFSVRRRARIEQVAIALRADPADTIIRLVSRSNREKPLVGYDVFAKNSAEEDDSFVAASGLDGRIRISPGEPARVKPPPGDPTSPDAADGRPLRRSHVRLLAVKNGAELLVRLPIVPGAVSHIDVPLPDDDARLRAEVRLAALREELIDVVAHRSIVLARVRRKIDAGELPQAQKLLAELDQLPGRSRFMQDIARERRLHRADDPRVQKRIDQLVAGTEAVVGKYLDARPVRELQEEIRNQQSRGSD